MSNTSLEKSLQKKILLGRQHYSETSPAFKRFQDIGEQLALHNIRQNTKLSLADTTACIDNEMDMQAIIIDWNIDNGTKHAEIEKLLTRLRQFNTHIPLFIVVERGSAAQIPLAVMRQVNGFFSLLEDTAAFIAGRIAETVAVYRQTLLPPMFSALVDYAEGYEYSWHTPGHTGGTAFLKSPVGKVFFDFFGEQIFRSDLSVSVPTLGTLLAHSGPIGEGERYAAQVYGADRTYYVTGGTSASNRMVITANLIEGDLALCDRNCHKSIEHALTLSGAIPVYLIPTRNQYGIIGPIPAQSLRKENICAQVKEHHLARHSSDACPRYAVITNSTYDGFCYNVPRVVSLLDETVDRLHFDEAWYAYARFHPLYADRYAMCRHSLGGDHMGPTVFATQSTHKLLAAFSQTSMVHVRDGRAPIEHRRFNESYAIHSTTSPFYPMIAANDISAAMMASPQGEVLMNNAIREAVLFRQMVSRINADFQKKGDWFFSVFQPDQILDAEGRLVPFHEADPEYLIKTPSCWMLEPGAAWHGFDDLEEDYCLLDPIKVNLIMPGLHNNAKMAEYGIPATILAEYLLSHNIVVGKKEEFSVFLLCSLGITRSKWGTMVNALMRFKEDYDHNRPLEETLPSLMQKQPQRYKGMHLKDLCDEMFAVMQQLRTIERANAVFSSLPQADMTPGEAYKKLVKNKVEQVPLSKLAGRTLATAILPHPPAIPMMMPGENAGPEDGRVISYLKAMQTFDNRFPGFEHDIQGREMINAEYHFQCIA